MNEQMKQVLEVARSYVKLQNDAEGMFEGFGGRKPRPSDDDLRKVDEAIALLSQQAAETAAAAGVEPVIKPLYVDGSEVTAMHIATAAHDRDITPDEAADWIEKLVRHNVISKAAAAPVRNWLRDDDIGVEEYPGQERAAFERIATPPAEAQAAPVDAHSVAMKIVHEEAGRTLSRNDFDLCMRIAKRALSQQPAVRVPEDDSTAVAMRKVAEEHAHGLALALECILGDHESRVSSRWYESSLDKLSAYREAMNAIHERESPTFMGEPFLPKDQPSWIRNAKPPIADDAARAAQEKA